MIDVLKGLGICRKDNCSSNFNLGINVVAYMYKFRGMLDICIFCIYYIFTNQNMKKAIL